MINDKNIEIALKRIRKAKTEKNYFLDLSGLRLTEIPEDISDMQYLIELDLSSNFLTSLPYMVAKLRDLKILKINNNYLSEVDFIFGEYYLLEYFDLSNNHLYNFPESIEYLNNWVIIKYNNNPFIDKLPHPLRNSTLQKVKDYFQLISGQKRENKLYETKLIFVGRGEVGKTTLMKVLKNNKTKVTVGKEKTTHGINIDKMYFEVFYPATFPHYSHYSEAEDLYQKKQVLDELEEGDYEEGDVPLLYEHYENISEIFEEYDYSESIYYLSKPSFVKNFFIRKQVKANLWDFGGQEIYYSTHQFFLTKRSIYIFVWEPRKDNLDIDFEYWLNVIKLLGKESPVLVVMNKCDIRHVSINEKEYKKLFPNILSFHQVSCKNKIGINELNNAIVNGIKKLRHIGDFIPIQWIKTREELSNIKKDYITYTKFVNICKKNGITINKTQLELISDYLHDIGEIIHFKSDSALKSIVIIDPQWATQSVYSLIDSIPIQKKHGVFDYADLESYLDISRYPLETHHHLLQLMEKFAICFKVVGAQNLYIIPELLNSEIPNPNSLKDFEEKDALKYRVKFNFMPKGLVSRLICRLFYLLNSDNYWKDGVILNYESSKSLVTSNNILKTLDIKVIGHQKRDLLTIIRNEMSMIYNDFNIKENYDFSEEIPCNCDLCITDNEPYYYNYQVLRKFIEKDKTYIDCQKSVLSVDINRLLSFYRNSKPETKLIYKILSAISKLQGMSKTINKDEDSRNSYIASMLSVEGILAKDQSRWGQSSKGNNQGELDIKIEQGEEYTIFEGMNLTYLNRQNINHHIIKVINKYDVNGIPDKFLGVYFTGKKFETFCLNYLEYIQNFDEEGIKFENIIDETKQLTPYTEVKIYKSYYIKSGSKISLTHILINII